MSGIVVYGTGAVGGVIAGRLRTAGADVIAVARGDHLAAIGTGGLHLVSEAGTETIGLPAVGGASEVDWSTAPAVVLTVKSHQTAAALDDLVVHAPPDTAVFAAQNGVANEAAILRRFANVYGVAVMLPAAHVEPGVVVQQSHPVPGILDLGRYPAGRDRAADELAEALREAGFHSDARTDVMAWKYRKLIANLANGVTAAYRPGPEADELVASARAEAVRILTLAGIPFVTAEQDRERRGDVISARFRPDYLGSTWQSVARGHTDVETDWFNGEIVLQARLLGESAPVNELIQRVTADHARRNLEPRSRDAGEALRRLAAARPVPG